VLSFHWLLRKPKCPRILHLSDSAGEISSLNVLTLVTKTCDLSQGALCSWRIITNPIFSNLFLHEFNDFLPAGVFHNQADSDDQACQKVHLSQSLILQNSQYFKCVNGPVCTKSNYLTLIKAAYSSKIFWRQFQNDLFSNQFHKFSQISAIHFEVQVVKKTLPKAQRTQGIES